jgi:hypothetical protein
MLYLSLSLSLSDPLFSSAAAAPASEERGHVIGHVRQVTQRKLRHLDPKSWWFSSDIITLTTRFPFPHAARASRRLDPIECVHDSI